MRRAPLAALLIAVAIAGAAPALDPVPGPVIAVVIDDLGDQLEAGRQALALPAVVSVAILPHTPYGETLALEAHAAGREVWLHQPLQAVEPGPLGPGAILLDMDRATLAQTLADNLTAVPHVVGVNNHMGSMLTRHPGHMAWLMEELAARELMFLDSRTTAQTVALETARAAGVAAAERDVFLDSDPDPEAIRAQLHRAEQLAAEQGYAIVIGHPYPATLAVLAEALPELRRAGYRLVAASRVVRMQSR